MRLSLIHPKHANAKSTKKEDGIHSGHPAYFLEVGSSQQTGNYMSTCKSGVTLKTKTCTSRRHDHLP